MRYLVIAGCVALLAAPAPGYAQTGWFELEVPGSVENISGVGVSRRVQRQNLRHGPSGTGSLETP